MFAVLKEVFRITRLGQVTFLLYLFSVTMKFNKLTYIKYYILSNNGALLQGNSRDSIYTHSLTHTLSISWQTSEERLL